jgi:hypothetical protein
MGRAMVALWIASYPRPPQSVILDIDDTVDVVHGHQQLSLFNAHYDERKHPGSAQDVSGADQAAFAVGCGLRQFHGSNSSTRLAG